MSRWIPLVLVHYAAKPSRKSWHFYYGNETVRERNVCFLKIQTFSPLVSFFTSGNTMWPLYDLSLTHSNTTSSLCFLISTMFLPLSPRDWIQALSAYATSSFLRAAELGAENREPWVVENAAIYLWNYSSQLLAAGEYQRLLPTFQTLVEMLRKTEYTG